MIAKMKKAVLVMQDDSKTVALDAIRKLGVVHLEPLEGLGERHAELKAAKADLESAIALLSNYKASQKPVRFSEKDALDNARSVISLQAEAKHHDDTANLLTKEIDRVEQWGDFDPRALKEISSDDIEVSLYETSPKQLASIPEDIRWIRLSEKKGLVRIAVLDRNAKLDGLRKFTPPEKNLSVLKTERENALSSSRDCLKRISDMADICAALSASLKYYVQSLQFETVSSGMANEGDLSWFSGYVPDKRMSELKKVCVDQGIGIMFDDPGPDDLPPSKVENNALIRVIQPVFDFLGTTPNYREYDISGWFMLFFVVFFAMIFGDAGYGTIMVMAALVFSVKAKVKTGIVPDALKLLLILSSSTLAWGIMTGSWFGTPPDVLPPFMMGVTIPWISNANPEAGTNIKILCFIIGTVQLSIAHLKNIKRDFPNLKFLAQVGSLALVIGMFNLVLNLVIDPEKYPVPDWAMFLIVGGFLLVFIFGSWTGNLVTSILEGLKNIIPTFLGTVSVFADIVSYIRLWAVGLAGVAISVTVNGMAMGLFKPLFMAVFGVVILGLGHTLNIVMSVLSVVVHGVRLNMLEFSGHLGMEWSGYKYEPFKKTVEEDTIS